MSGTYKKILIIKSNRRCGASWFCKNRLNASESEIFHIYERTEIEKELGMPRNSYIEVVGTLGDPMDFADKFNEIHFIRVIDRNMYASKLK